jgi:hypothetical protein
MADASNILKRQCRLIHKKQYNFKFISVSAFSDLWILKF